MTTAMHNQATAAESTKERLKTALSQARQVCDVGSESSADCKMAWETVAELGIATSTQEQDQPFFDTYCGENPGAMECKVYDT